MRKSRTLMWVLLLMMAVLFTEHKAYAGFPSNLYLEIGGDAFVGSINVEKLLDRNTYLRAGATGWKRPARNESGYELKSTFLFGAGYLFKLKGNSRIEAGLTVSRRNSATVFTVPVGYRYQPEKSGFIFRLTFVPFVSQEGLLPWIGISLGRTF